MSSVAVREPAALEVEASLNYLLATGQRPVSYAYEPPAGTPQYSGVNAPQRVVIRNARPLVESHRLGLDRSGFEVVAHTSAVTDFSDESLIRSVYYSEAQALIKRITGASSVLIFDHTLRDSSRGQRWNTLGERSNLREPARRVHNDQTFKSGPRRVLDHLPPDEALIRLRSRFAIVNLWRPIGDPVEEAPLAMCDARSIEPEDLVPGDLVYHDKIGETYAVTYNPRHRWYYYPRLKPEEALLLKIYDSHTEGVARLTAHTSFEDPTSPPDAKPRRSIELRTLAFF